jgi:hypothetical protein
VVEDELQEMANLNGRVLQDPVEKDALLKVVR